MRKALRGVAGGVGLWLALTSLFTLIVAGGSLTPFFVKMGLGVLLLVTWVLAGGERPNTWARSAFFYSSSVGLSLALVAVLIAANYIVANKSPSWDLTARKIHSLSLQTQSALRELQDPVRLVAFVEGPAPEQLEELFKRYSALTASFTYEFLDPRKSPDLTQQYQIRQGQPAAVLISKGAREMHAILNLKRLGDRLLGEQELTNGLIKLQKVGEQKLYFLVGHGEFPLEPVGDGEDEKAGSLITLKRALEEEGYAPQPLNLIERGEIPLNASAVVVAGARSRFSENEQKLLRLYLEQGGRLLYFAEAQGDAGLDELLSSYGTQLEPGLVADSKVNPDQPYIVYTPFLGEHEMTRPLKKEQQNVVFATSRAITLLKQETLPDLTVTPLVLTTPYAWVESSLSRNPQADSGERTGQLVLAVAMSRPSPLGQGRRTDETRVLLFGDSDLLTGTFGYEPNRNLVMNAFAWTTQQLKKITIRPPDRDISTIDLTPQRLEMIRLLSIDLFPTLLMAIGLTIWQRRRAR